MAVEGCDADCNPFSRDLACVSAHGLAWQCLQGLHSPDKVPWQNWGALLLQMVVPNMKLVHTSRPYVHNLQTVCGDAEFALGTVLIKVHWEMVNT